MKDPSRYLHVQEIPFRCPVHPDRAAVVDSAHQVAVGHDLFFFSDLRAREAFRRDPLRWARALSDPVTEQRVRPDRRSPSATYHGRVYYFRSDSTRRAFAAMPDSVAIRHGM